MLYRRAKLSSLETPLVCQCSSFNWNAAHAKDCTWAPVSDVLPQATWLDTQSYYRLINTFTESHKGKTRNTGPPTSQNWSVIARPNNGASATVLMLDDAALHIHLNPLSRATDRKIFCSALYFWDSFQEVFGTIGYCAFIEKNNKYMQNYGEETSCFIFGVV